MYSFIKYIGTIPNQLTNLTGLSLLDLNKNQLNGKFYLSVLFNAIVPISNPNLEHDDIVSPS